MLRLHSINTDRLRLRPFRLEDAPTVQRLAGDWDVAKMTLNIPHPYEDGMAEQWIEAVRAGMKNGDIVTFAIVSKTDDALVGAVSLRVNKASRWAELGYWIGKPYWNNGFGTEAARALVEYGFCELGLNRIQARHMIDNPASGRIMQKVGMTREGTLRQAGFRGGSFHDLVLYAILRDEFEQK